MGARVTTVAFRGIETVEVDVQIHVGGGGMGAVSLVGLADKAVTETPIARAALVDLAEDWSRLASLLQKGELQLVRILAMKRGES